MLTVIKVICVAYLLFLLGSQDSNSVAQGQMLSILTKPDPDDSAASARWLLSLNSWGVLNTISTDLNGAPFGLNWLMNIPRKPNLLEFPCFPSTQG
ncbi:hypothetical protein PIB30_085106 [Stylosanthes scabra]|uniref:CREG-like beta-barrel domain-containing protein n=1 Tax=Stylosanthes scabra TaxID=79078 RepID=A0ABU6YU37_9FABA|nr:hypothetical protein [Stylosanthes scabra]